MRILAQGFEQIASLDAEFSAGAPKLTTLRGFLTIAAIHGNPIGRFRRLSQCISSIAYAG